LKKGEKDCISAGEDLKSKRKKTRRRKKENEKRLERDVKERLKRGGQEVGKGVVFF